jgi:hypothetical protein
MTTPTTTTLDGNWRLRYHPARRRRTTYVSVVDGMIVNIQPELTNWLDRPFRGLCRWMRKRYPKTFDAQHWCEQLIEPTSSEPTDSGEGQPDPLQLSCDVAKTCVQIQSTWSDADERERRTGTAIEKPYVLPGTGVGLWIPWHKQDEVADCDELLDP